MGPMWPDWVQSPRSSYFGVIVVGAVAGAACSTSRMGYDPTTSSYEVGYSALRAGGVALVARWPIGGPAAPVVICCHGFTGDADNLSELSAAWAARGYVVLHPTFDDSPERIAAARPELKIDTGTPFGWTLDPAVFEEVVAVTFDPQTWMGRVDVVASVLDQLTEVGATLEGLVGGLDPSRVAVAGHSLGAYTSQLVAGVTIEVPEVGVSSYRDERVQAAILLAGQGRHQWGLNDGSWDTLVVPLLNIAGGADTSSATGQDPTWRLEPYELAPPGDRYQGYIDGMDHGLGGLAEPNFSGWTDDPTARAMIIATSSAFLDHVLRQDLDAAAWLQDGPRGLDGADRLSWATK